MKGAIEQYKQIAGGRDRAFAAKALVAMAECYQKLGDAEAQKIYERVVREFADQTEAASVARAHLGRTETAATSAGMTSRRVWTEPLSGALFWSRISPNGRFLTYTDWSSVSGGDLVVHDFATGRDRLLSNRTHPWDYAADTVISPDSKQVAYAFDKGQDRSYELRLATIEGAGLSQSRLLFTNQDITWLGPYDWSPDGNWIAVQLTRKDNSQQMGLISVRDGSLRVLKSVDWQGADKLFFSPDSKYLGFDAPVGDNRNNQRDVFVLAVDGSREVPAVVGPSNDTMMGWSPDGRYLLFASDRGATTGLWAVPIADGRPQGSPEVMKPEISPFSAGVTTSGSLYSRVVIGGSDVQIAAVDFQAGKLVSSPVNPAKSFMGFNQAPDWSPDGKYLSYASNRQRMGAPRVISIWSSETGQVREIQPKLNTWAGPHWAPDGRSLIVQGRDLKGRQGQYQVDVQTGEATPTNLPAGQPSPDGKKAYYAKNYANQTGNERAFIERDLASGNEREIIRRPVRDNAGGTFALHLSPDARFIATTSNDESTRSSVVLLVPVSGGEPRELLRVRQPQAFNATASWMLDGRAVLVIKSLNESGRGIGNELWLIPIDGSEPRKIDLGTTTVPNGGVKVHPDGRQIAYVAGDGEKSEIWALENFLPALNAKK